MIKALKYERMIAKNKADMAIDLLKSCQCYKNFNAEDATAKVLYRQVNRRIKKVNELTDRINELIKSIDKRVFARDITLKSIKRKKELQSKLDNK
jgi:ABC-type phosphate transport system auxiliary subunit